MTNFAEAEFYARAASVLLKQPPAPDEESGDFALNPDLRRLLRAPLRDAAVLVPVVDRTEGLTILLTRRRDTLSAHAGQVAFPGGKVDAGDDGAIGCALREAEEEVGLPPARVEPLGYLPAYVTGTGFRIVPVLARVALPFDPRPSEAEVDAVFEVPLRFLMNPANHRIGHRSLAGVERSFYEMPYGDHYIWGATAGIIRGLYERVFAG